MKINQAFVAHHCVNRSSQIEQSLTEKKYLITKKDYDGIKTLRYIIREKPDVCILEASYNELSALDIIKEAKLKNSKSKFIIVFKKVRDIDVVMAKQFDVSGCVSCDDSIEEVLTCLDKVHNNERYFSTEVLQQIDKDSLESYTNFTSLQMKIIAFIGFYNSPEKLAKKLNMAISSVNEEMDLIKNQLRLTHDQSLHLWAANNTSFVETLMLTKVS